MMRLCLLTTLLLSAVAANGADSPAPQATFSLRVDLAADVGQSFGTLFEVKNAAGLVVAGAGFEDAYNTRFRTDRHTLQFFARPDAGDDRYTIERLPHPDLDCGVYLFDLNGQVYAWTSVGGNSVRRWDAAAGEWLDELPPHTPGIRSGDGVMRVGKGQLTFADDTAWYNDRVILAPPAEGGYHDFYYAHGRLCFYHRTDGDPPTTELLACEWTPADNRPIDVTAAARFTTKYARETPFAWGQWDDQILTVSNMGGLYVFEEGQWRTALEPDDKTSYQVYSMLRWYDRLLLAQYPTGNIFAYRGEQAEQIENWPPRMAGVSPSARECQTLAIYRGDLWAGVWPWAELWRRDRQADQWTSLGRLFTHPQATDEFVHPYETEATRQGLVLNHWGQRITSMIPHGDSLLLSTSSKGTSEWKDEYDFLSDEQRREYGAVLRLKMPGNLAAQIDWQDRPIDLEFAIEPGKLSIQQDGRLLAETTLPDDFSFDVTELTVDYGRGANGPLAGKLLEYDLSTNEGQP